MFSNVHSHCIGSPHSSVLVLEDMRIIMEWQQLATQVFSAKLKIFLSEPTIRSIRDVYCAEINIRIKLGESGAITSLPERKCGRSK